MTLRGPWLVGALALAIVAAIGVGLRVMGSPREARIWRVDGTRLDDLRHIDAAIGLFWTRQSRLPESLAEVAREPGVAVSLNDPGTGRPYEYRVTGDRAYELCATFERAASGEAFWSHGFGRHCFAITARRTNR